MSSTQSILGRVGAALALLAVSGTGSAQAYRRIEPAKGYDDIHLTRAALPGQQIRIWWAMLLNPDCTPAGTMTTAIVTPPHHGEATISDEPFFPSYVDPNPRAACDMRKAPGKQAFYTPTADFRGHDKVVLNNATSEGRMRRIIIDIDVR